MSRTAHLLRSSLFLAFLVLASCRLGSTPLLAQSDRSLVLPVRGQYDNPLRERVVTAPGVAAGATPRRFDSPPSRAIAAPAGVSSGPSSIEPSAGATANSSSPAPTTPPVTRESIEQALKVVAESTELAEEVRTELTKRYGKALEWLKSAEESARLAATYDAEIRQGDELIAAAKSELAASLPDPQPRAPDDAPVTQLEQQLREVEAKLKAATDELAASEETIKRRTERTTELTKLIAETQQRLDEVRKQNGAATVEGDPTAEVKRLENETRLLALERQLVLLQTESRRYEALTELFPLRRDIAKRAVSMREKEVAAWQKLVARRRKEESQRQAIEARRQVENAHPALRSVAQRNAELAETRQTLSASINRATSERKRLQERTARLTDEFDKINEKVARAGHSTTVGLMLRKMGDELPDAAKCEERLDFIERETPTVHLRLMELREEREPIGDIESLADEVISGLDAKADLPVFMREMVVELLQSKRDLLDRLIEDHDAYLKELSELELAHQNLLARTEQVSDYVGEHVLWIRSTEPLALDHLRALPGALAAVVHPPHWFRVARQTGIEAVRRPYQAVLIVLVGAALLLLHRRLAARLRTVCDGASRQGRMKFLPTLEGLLVSVVLSAQWPLLIFFVGWRLASGDASDDFVGAVAQALLIVAAFLWLSESIRRIMRPEGIAETHFSWPSGTLRGVRSHLQWFTLFGLPLTFVTALSLRLADGAWAASLGRVTFITGMLLLAFFFHSLLYPSGRVFREMKVVNPDGWLFRFRHLVHGLSTLAPITLAALAVVGYFYSAQQLALRIQYTVAFLLGLALTHAVVSRWFLVKRRNLAIEQARQRRAEAQENTAAGADGVQAPPLPQAERDLSAIHQQLHHLLRYAVIGCILLVGWWIWSDVLPALRAFDRAVIWNNKVEVTETVEEADGQKVARTHEKDVPTTLRHAMIAVLLVVVTYLLGQKLPALLEITVLDHLPIDVGGRHAVSVLMRYAVALSGVVLACRAMSISWSSVQWLAAAMTVGLGFGLQEIFANLVSGLIVLFERPIRVGDIVTVGNVTGTVRQMRMRATTVMDFDRRELIVPNKKFITDDVINWTLSDPISRVVISVGIAYGSDTALAHSLLLKAAREHPVVMREPEATAMFKGFGESTLDFDLRVFIPNRDVYSLVLHELNSAIDRYFRDAGIEVAFPQRDLHVRSWTQAVALPTEKPKRRGEAA